MIIKYIKNNDPQIDLTKGVTYSVVSVERGWYRIIDDSGSDYLYPPEMFEIISEQS